MTAACLEGANGIGRVDGGFRGGLKGDVRGSAGGARRLNRGRWAAMRPAIEIIALRYGEAEGRAAGMHLRVALGVPSLSLVVAAQTDQRPRQPVCAR